MSVLYPDLSLTAFPGDIDSFTTWLDIIASDGALVLQYQQAMQTGNTVLANQILAQIPSASQKIIKATDLNKMTQAILAVERFYKTDVEPYIQEQQANWLEIIQRFSYKGEWASGTTYEVNNFVSYTVSGATLIYLATSNPPVGTPPTNTNYWRLLSIQGQQGPSGEGVSYREEWAPTTQYYKDDTVTYGGALWIATQNSQGQTPQSGSQYWELVMSLGLTTYPIQDSEPTGQEVGGLWFNTQTNPTNYYQLATLENPATAAQISAGYEAYNDDGEVITGTQSTVGQLNTAVANVGVISESVSGGRILASGLTLCFSQFQSVPSTPYTLPQNISNYINNLYEHITGSAVVNGRIFYLHRTDTGTSSLTLTYSSSNGWKVTTFPSGDVNSNLNTVFVFNPNIPNINDDPSPEP